MLRSNNRLLLLCLLAVSLVFIGCQHIQPQTEEGPRLVNWRPPRDTTTKYNAPIKLNHWQVNPLPAQSQMQGQDTVLFVSGLKYKDVEEKINERLRVLYQSIKEGPLPPYRGIKVAIPDGSRLLESYLYTEVPFNFNNILSITVTNQRSYSIANRDYPLYVSSTQVLNLDLYTGEEITLRDLFADNVDYLDLLNQHIHNIVLRSNPGDEYSQWWYEGSNLNLVAPFKGLKPSQKFHLSMGGLVLLFDHETPEFATHLYPSRLTISFHELGDVLALARRFSTDSTIFESAELPRKELVYRTPIGMATRYTTSSSSKVVVETA